MKNFIASSGADAWNPAIFIFPLNAEKYLLYLLVKRFLEELL
jgi:hypothetical protein